MTNGRTTFFQWALGALLTLTIAVLVLNYQLVISRLDALEMNGSPAIRERLASTERDLTQIRRELEIMSTRQQRFQDRLEDNGKKLDQILVAVR